jgi:hypothetical protein
LAKNSSKPEEEKLAVYFQLEGPEVKRFQDYKSKAFLRGNAEAARKLMLERLSQIEAEESSHAATQV